MEIIQNQIKYVKQNIIFTKTNGVWCYFKIRSISINKFHHNNEESYFNNLTKLIINLKNYDEVVCSVIPKQFDVEKRVDVFESQFKDVYKDIGKYYMKRCKEILTSESMNVSEYQYCLGIKLRNKYSLKNNSFKGALRRFSRQVQGLAGIEELEDPDQDAYIQLKDDLTFEINNYITATPLKQEEMGEFVNYNFERKSDIDINSNVILNLSEYGYINLIKSNSNIFVAYLPVLRFPINMAYTRFLYNFQNINFPVHANLRIKYENKSFNLNEVNKIKNRIKDQNQQRFEADEEDDDLINNGSELLNRLENRIRNEDMPILYANCTYSIEGNTVEECSSKVKFFIEYMKKFDIELVQPVDQVFYFNECLPGSLAYKKDYLQVMNVESFGESMFGASRKVGNKVGMYLGKDVSISGETKQNSVFPVFYHPFIAHLGLPGSITSSPHVSISGPTGMGKSLLMKYIIFYSAFLGAKIIVIDPKNEYERNFKNSADSTNNKFFKTLVNSFNYITLSSDAKDKGKLDVLLFLRDDIKFSTAVSILESIGGVGAQERNIKTAINKCVEHAIKRDLGLLYVVDLLMNYDDIEVRHFGELIKTMSQNGLGQLLFAYSRDEIDYIDLNHSNVNIIQIQNISLPNENKPIDKQNTEEVISVAIMQAISKFSISVARDYEGLKMLVIEEAWAIQRTMDGKALTKELLRTGRSLQSSLYLVTQSGKDYDDQDIKEQIGNKFAFQAKDQREQEMILKYFELEINEVNLKSLSNMSEGECLFKDIYGRVSKISIDIIFNEWLNAFNTKEEASERVKAEVG